MSSIYLAHVKIYNPNTLSEETLYFSSSSYVTGTTNLPTGGVANTWYDPRISQPAMIQRDCWDGAMLSGESKIGYGTIELANSDGGLDYLLDYGLDGRRVTLLTGVVSPGSAPVWTQVFIGTMAQPVISTNRVSLYLRDRQAELDKPVCVNSYAGTNSLPNGLEGVADDIKGKRKPKLYGKCFNISPICVNTSRLIFQVNDGSISTVDAAYDRGAALTKGADYVSQADMESTAPAAGQYRVWPAGGYFRLGSALVGLLTCDATQGAAASNRTSAQIINLIATTSGGLTGADISSSDITALDALNNAEIGIYFQDETTCRIAISMAAKSIGAWTGFDRLGVLRAKRFSAPAGSPVVVLTEGEIKEINRISNTDNSSPAWKMAFKYRPNIVTQDNDFAGTVTQDRRASLAQSWRSILNSDAAVKTARLLAIDTEVESYMIDATASATEATRVFNLYKVQRQLYEVTSFIDASLQSLIDLGAEIQIKISRFGMSAGKNFIITGYKTDMNTRKVILSIWG